MEIKILELSEGAARFLLRGSYPAFANALRRIMISDVPSMAIDDVFIYENSSAVHDEIIAHRLGMVPLKTDLDRYVLPEECDCGSEMGCPKCRAIGTLDVEAEGEARTVYSGDIQFDDPEVAPVSPKVPIVKLAPGQRLKLEVHARLGTGRQHAKWQPVSACAYKYVPVVEIDRRRCDACGKCVEYCPKKILKVEEGKLRVADEMLCTLCRECVKRCPKEPPAINVRGDETSFIFYVESTGCLPVDRIILEAAKILRKKVDSFAERIREVR